MLLDTHALVWAINEPGRLGAAARGALEDRGNVLLVSAVSGWEMATKHRLGRMPGAGPFLSSLSTQLSRLGADVLEVSLQHALVAGQLEWEHRDPFDRMLAAQALTDSLILVTKDKAFAELPAVTTLWS